MSGKPTTEELLKQVPLFAGLSADQFSICAKAWTAVSVAADEMLFARGEPGDRMYVVVQGRVRLSLVSEGGRELSVRVAGPGELIGEMATLDRGNRSADAVALDQVEAISLTRRALDRLLIEMPDLAGSIIAFLCARLRETTNQLESIALHSVEERLARLLLAEIGLERTSAGSTPRALALPQAELAQLVGASRPKVNLALTALERSGAIRRSGKGTAFDIAILKRLAGLADE